MNSWLIAASVLALGILPCGSILLRAEIMDRVVALQATTTICVMILTLVAVGFHRGSFLDIALALALLNYPASLLYAHFLERWL